MSIHFLEDVTTDAAVEHGALDDMEFRVLAFQVLYGLVDAAATRRSKEYDLGITKGMAVQIRQDDVRGCMPPNGEPDVDDVVFKRFDMVLY